MILSVSVQVGYHRGMEDRPHPPPAPATWGALSAQSAHRSFWRARLARKAEAYPGPTAVLDWLVDQANLRNFSGAVNAVCRGVLDPSLTLEEIVVGLLTPDATAEGRILKLATRILQSELDLEKLLLLAKRERAERLLSWLVSGIPEQERFGTVPSVLAVFGQSPPRGGARVRYDYDFGRLILKAATRTGARWKPART